MGPDIDDFIVALAVGKNTGGAQAVQVRQRFQRTRIQPVGERVVEQEGGESQQGRFVIAVLAEGLRRPQVVGIAQFGSPRFVDRLVARLSVRAEVALQVRGQVGAEAVVVQQGVVDVEQEHHSR